MRSRQFLFLAAFSAGVAVLGGAKPADGAIVTLGANLSGVQETTPNASPATGIGMIVLDDVAKTIKVNESWSGLSAAASASHIHTGAIGISGPVTFPFTGVPAASAGAIPEQVFSVTPAQIASLEAGQMYFNIHTSAFPGGEIRGQISVVPEPAMLGLLGTGVMALMARRRRAGV